MSGLIEKWLNKDGTIYEITFSEDRRAKSKVYYASCTNSNLKPTTPFVIDYKAWLEMCKFGTFERIE